MEDKLYHAPFTAWLSTPRGLRYLFELMRDIMERFRSCHRCVTHVTQPQRVPLRRSSYLQLIKRAVTAANVQHLHSASLYICTLTHTLDAGFMPLDMIACKYHLPSASPTGNMGTCVSHCLRESPVWCVHTDHKGNSIISRHLCDATQSHVVVQPASGS